MGTQAILQTGTTIRLAIEKLVHGGEGLAHYGTKACFVKDVIPGEKVTVRVDKALKQYILCSPVAFLKKSPHRIEPPCPYFRSCGGCQWQHIAYDHQLQYKTTIITDCLQRIGGIQDISVPMPLPSPDDYNYRSRCQLKVRYGRQPLVGYYQEKSHKVIDVACCALLCDPLSPAIDHIRKIITDNPASFKNVFDADLLCIHNTGQAVISFSFRNRQKKKRFVFCDRFQETDNLKEPLVEEILNMKFVRDTEGFYQVNYQQNIALIKIVLNYLKPFKGCTVFDLFCGSGNFSLFLARAGAEVLGVDSNPHAVTEARRNAKMNGITRCRFIASEAEAINKQLVSTTFNKVLLNPPRAGCTRKTLKFVASLQPETIVYVSCNPATLARDLRILIDLDYNIEAIQPLDMFPQTFHIETIVKLVR